jgi:hypothetical protein
MRGHKSVYLVPALEEMGAVDRQFVSQMLGRRTLRDTAQDLDDGGAAIASLPEDCGGEEVKDRTALAAAIVGNDRSPPTVGRLIGREQMAARTVQAVWVQNMQQEVIASLLIEQSIEWKTQHWSASFATGLSVSVAARGRPSISFTSQPT